PPAPPPRGGPPPRGAPPGAPAPPGAGTREELANLAEQAARLCKADLVTEMVGEFPELQGLMGGYYAAKEGLPVEVSDAIRDHYKPVGQGDDVPTAPVTVAVSLADKLDNLIEFFAVDERPTGSKDPYALRRAALGTIQTIFANGLRLNLAKVALAQTVGRAFDISEQTLGRQIVDFFADRLKVQQREAGVRHDIVDAVTELVEEDDLVRLLARVHALQAFIETENGTNLLAGYKRAANILKKENHTVTPAKAGVSSDGAQVPEMPAFAGMTDFEISYSPETAERALIDALAEAAPTAEQAVRTERFADAMAALATLRGPIDAFFDEVTVNDDDSAKREARLNLLARFTAAVGNVADFSRIEG
ncbi:glycine--tRNA ligase subunit beta, partial [Qipengyuania sp. ASV99]|uniref:glycine--tRNA ligase subunit beta n=1 Tax=Qipengyuania sp. ASV99 TaxID=3399681 RepID=UPI003A4C6856